jgi:hypothetical protein
MSTEQTEPLQGAIRAERRKRALGANARCATCGWAPREALVKTKTGVRCYECQLQADGKMTTEAHHHLGRAVDPATVTVPGNVHRDLSEHQRDWDPASRVNPQRDPLLWLAAAAMGLHDHLAWWVDWLGRIAAWLARLSAHLTERDGARWWEPMGLAPVWAEGTA